MRSGCAWLLAFCAPMLLVASVASARPFSPVGAEHEATPSMEVPGLDRIGVDEKLEQPLPLDLTFRNHEGKIVRLRDLFDGKRPVLLTFAYYTCPVLCNLVLDAASGALADVPWTVGSEFEVVTISIDPRDTPETATKKRTQVLEKYGRSKAGWHFLVGDEDAIAAATRAAGFRYFYDARQKQYAHPAAIMFMTPDGRFARYLYGIQFAPADARLALLEASEGRSISTIEKVILYCYSYDPEASSYSVVAWRVMQLGGGLTVVVLGAFLSLLWRREVRRRARGRDDSNHPQAHAQVETP